MAGNSVDSGDASNALELKTESGLVNSISISPSGSLEKNIGDTFTIKATVGPENAINKNVNWTTSNSNIASLSTTTTVSGTSLTVTCNAKGPVTITATTDDGSGKSATLTLTVVRPYKWGNYVNYPVTLGLTNSTHTLVDGTIPKTDWRILYKDNTYTYIIAADYIPANKIPTAAIPNNNGHYNVWWSSEPAGTTPNDSYKNRFLWNGLDIVSKSNANYKATTYFLETNLWSEFVDRRYADACIGGATIEMIAASWNQEYPKEQIYYGVNSKGYTVGTSANSTAGWVNISSYEGFSQENSLYFPHNKEGSTSDWNGCIGYYLASPSEGHPNYSLNMNCLGYVYNNVSWQNNGLGVRPVVCLKSTVTMTKDANGIWQLSN